MSTKLAVMLIHGHEINDSHVADTAMALSRREFARCSGINDRRVMRPVAETLARAWHVLPG